MSKSYKLGKKCKKCGKLISDKSKSGYCGECYLKYGMKGQNNPFFGKHHSSETVKKIKEKCSNASKELWKNQEYRTKVITNMTGLKRDDDFKETQRKNALKQFQDATQREIRSEVMKNTWKNGNISEVNKFSYNRSRQEKEFIQLLKEEYKEAEILTNQTLTKKNKRGRDKHLYPDGIIPKHKIIIEYNGNFWHANPKIYKSDDIIHHGVTAQEIWERDNDKIKTYQEMGYKVIIVWQEDFLKNKALCVQNTVINIKATEEINY